MAAFINALYEEGTRKDCLLFLHREREDCGMDRLTDDDFADWTKQELLDELARLWYANHPKTKISER